MDPTGLNRWPCIPVGDWQDTRDTLQLLTQIVANEPPTIHWWNVPLYVSARGDRHALERPTGESRHG